MSATSFPIILFLAFLGRESLLWEVQQEGQTESNPHTRPAQRLCDLQGAAIKQSLPQIHMIHDRVSQQPG